MTGKSTASVKAAKSSPWKNNDEITVDIRSPTQYPSAAAARMNPIEISVYEIARMARFLQPSGLSKFKVG